MKRDELLRLPPVRRLRIAIERLELSRLNHIFIPARSDERERLRRGWVVRVMKPVLFIYGAYTREGRALLLFTMVVGLAGFDAQRSHLYMLWAALVGLLSASLVARRALRPVGLEVRVDVPRRVSLGDEVRFSITVRNRGDVDFDAIRVRGPMLPWDGVWTQPRPADAVVPSGERVTLSMAARFVARGEHQLDPFEACAIEPLGLSQGGRVSGLAERFLVVPRVAEVKAFAAPKAARHQPGGVALASKTGESMELLGVRPYRPGDPVRDLHARSWAKVGIPIVREWQQEYFSRFGVVVDIELPRDASPKRLEAALSLSAGVVAYLSRGDALIDILVVGDEVHPLTVGRSLGTLDQVLDRLACVEKATPLVPEELLPRLSPHLARLSCVVLVTMSWGPSQERLLGMLKSKVPCRVLLVCDDPIAAPATMVEADAVLAGRPLTLL